MIRTRFGLEKLIFHSCHGVHEDEKIYGNRFEIDVDIEYFLYENDFNDEIEKVINYSKVYELISQIMNHKSVNLLETLAFQISKSICENFPSVEQCTIRISKFHPPIKGLCEKAFVEICYENS